MTVAGLQHYLDLAERFQAERAAGAPAWLRALRQEGIAQLARQGFPTSKLEDWKSELQDKQEVVQEALSSEDEVIKNLAEGPYQDAARETFDEFRSIFADGMKLLFDKTKDAEDQLRV